MLVLLQFDKIKQENEGKIIKMVQGKEENESKRLGTAALLSL